MEVPLKPSDVKRILARLCSETGATEETARRAYEETAQVYDKAKSLLLRWKTDEIEQKGRKAQAWLDMVRMQELFALRYRLDIHPQIIRFMDDRVTLRPDPLVDDGDSFRLQMKMIERGATVYAEQEFGLTVWHATRQVGDNWLVGKGGSDVPREGLVLAWWDVWGEEE